MKLEHLLKESQESGFYSSGSTPNEHDPLHDDLFVSRRRGLDRQEEIINEGENDFLDDFEPDDDFG